MRNLTGPLVGAFFAWVWAAVALGAVGAPAWAFVAPGVVSAALALLTRRNGDGPARKDGRLVGISFALEFVAIFAGIYLVARVGRPDLGICVAAAIVGAHFLPLAHLLPARGLYVTGLALMIDAGAGVLLPSDLRVPAVAGAAAAILWAGLLAHLLVQTSRRATSAS